MQVTLMFVTWVTMSCVLYDALDLPAVHAANAGHLVHPFAKSLRVRAPRHRSITKADRPPSGRDALAKRIDLLCRHFQGSLYVQVCRWASPDLGQRCRF